MASLLTEARAAGVDRLDAQLLLARALGRPRTWLLAHDHAAVNPMLTPESLGALRAQLARRADGEPLAYLLGEKEFHGLMLHVDSRVLVPRPETEVLVDWALEWLAGAFGDIASPRVLDLGTGSGAIGLAMKHRYPRATVLATDSSTAAIDVAQHNAQRLGLDVRFRQANWWQTLDHERFDLVLSNPPYIAATDNHLFALRHEPSAALTPGGDGLGAHRDIIAGALAHLEPGGCVLLEHGFDQADAVSNLLLRHGFDAVETRPDLAGRPRCTGATLASAPTDRWPPGRGISSR